MKMEKKECQDRIDLLMNRLQSYLIQRQEFFIGPESIKHLDYRIRKTQLELESLMDVDTFNDDINNDDDSLGIPDPVTGLLY